MDDLNDILGRAWDEQDAGETVAAADPPPNDVAPADTGDQPTGEGSGQDETGDGGDEFAHWQHIIDGDPALSAKARALQGDYTRKAQALAEQRKQFEGIDAAQLAQMQQVYRLATEDPATLAAWLQQQAQAQGFGQAAPPGETATYEAEPVTEVERIVLERMKAYEAKQEQLDRFYQAQVQSQQLERIGAEFGEIEKQAGRAIPADERQRIAQHCLDRNIPNVTDGFRSLYFEQEMARAMQRGRDEAAAVVTAKAAGTGAPSGIVNRAPTTRELPADTGKGIEAIWDRLAGGG